MFAFFTQETNSSPTAIDQKAAEHAAATSSCQHEQQVTMGCPYRQQKVVPADIRFHTR